MGQETFRNKEIKSEATKLIQNIDWKWMLYDGGKNPKSDSFTMGYAPEVGFLSGRWSSQFENPFFNIFALGASSSVPTSTWAAFKRNEMSYGGRTFITGGPLFMHEMSQHFLDMKGKRDSLGYDYWVAARNFALSHRQYCIDNPKKFAGYGADTWGLNACDTPDGYIACSPFGPSQDNGTLMPSATVGTIMFTPEHAIRAAYAFKKQYPEAYGRYGFANGINPSKKWTDVDVIGIDLGMVMLSIENYRDGLPHRLLERSPIVRRGMARAGFHRTREGAFENRKLRTLPVK